MKASEVRKLRVGDWVQSRYRAQWYGRVVQIIPRSNGMNPLLKVKPVFSASKQPIQMKGLKTYDCHWFIKTGDPTCVAPASS